MAKAKVLVPHVAVQVARRAKRLDAMGKLAATRGCIHVHPHVTLQFVRCREGLGARRNGTRKWLKLVSVQSTMARQVARRGKALAAAACRASISFLARVRDQVLLEGVPPRELPRTLTALETAAKESR